MSQLQTKNDLTAEYVRSLFDYHAESGQLIWKVRRSSKQRVGQVAGCYYRSTGYLYVGVDYKQYLVHRLIWLHVHGEWPEHVVDHINGVRIDNRIENLRDVTQTGNMRNMRRAHSDNMYSGLLGVTYDKRWRCFKARISVDGRSRHIGNFATEEAAHRAFVEAKRVLHETCTL